MLSGGQELARAAHGVWSAFAEHAACWSQIHAGALRRFADGRVGEQRVALAQRHLSAEQSVARAARALRLLPTGAVVDAAGLAHAVGILAESPGRQRWAAEFARAAWHRVRADIAERPELPSPRGLPSAVGPGAWSLGGDAGETARALLTRLGRGLPLVDLWRDVAVLADCLRGLSDPRTVLEVRALASLLAGAEHAFGVAIARGPGGPAPLLLRLARRGTGVQLEAVAVSPRETGRMLEAVDGLAIDLGDPFLAVDYIARVAPWFGCSQACASLGLPEVGAERLRRECTAVARDHGVVAPEDLDSDVDLAAVHGFTLRRPDPAAAAPWFRVRNLVLDRSWCDGEAWARLVRLPGRRLLPGGCWCGTIDLMRTGDVTNA
ncbi:MAG: hypothetical protein RL562_607 [Planctomycetota bacterium]